MAAILFPVFAKAREKARQSSCSSNLKQLGVALIQYQQDYDEVNCRRRPAGSSPRTEFWWFVIDPYVKNDQLKICPSYKWNGGWCGGCNTNCRPNNTRSYDMGSGGIRSMTDGPANSEIILPSETIWAMDCYCEYSVNPHTVQYSVGWWLETRPKSQISCWRHNEGINAVFVDGHAKWVNWIKASDLSIAEDNIL